MKVFVYGSLKKGFPNHYLLADSEFVTSDMVTGYSMESLGAFPMAVSDPEEALDTLESEGIFYDRILISGEVEENFFMYIQSRRTEKIENNQCLEIWNKGYK